ncbi:MAG: gamma-glutamyl-gamma-aminobutyrate hydrolase family protein [Bdellovibrionales bacterium]|nr:gamma-glutamyl-gamma-aminobutyrate hydrolase family protein [Bdellovibrionales bacterium]
MKRILISQRVIENDSYPETRDCLDIEWSHFLSEINILCCPISSMAPVKEYFSQDVAGVVLSGGNDLNCITKSKVNKLRDETEKQVLDYCVENKIPLLGVCRGLQFIANYFGIKLYPLEGHVATKHQVEVSSESLYQKFFLELTEVNSYHNYGIKNITSDFIASVTASDGSIEAIEHKTLPILGMMWHPERNFPFSESDKSLFKLFFNA